MSLGRKKSLGEDFIMKFNIVKHGELLAYVQSAEHVCMRIELTNPFAVRGITVAMKKLQVSCSRCRKRRSAQPNFTHPPYPGNKVFFSLATCLGRWSVFSPVHHNDGVTSLGQGGLHHHTPKQSA